MIRIITLAILILFARSVTAQTGQNCAPHDIMVAGLAGRYGETLRAQGLGSSETAVVEMFANDETGTWTIVITTTGGIACMVSAGKGFKSFPGGEAL